MPRKPAPAPVDPTNEYENPQLEPVTDRLKIVLFKWGRATDECVNELAMFAPNWAHQMKQLKDIIGSTLQDGQ